MHAKNDDECVPLKTGTFLLVVFFCGNLMISCLMVVFFGGDWGVTRYPDLEICCFFLKLMWFFYVHRLNLWSQLAELCPADGAFQQKDKNDKTDVLNPHIRKRTSLRKRGNVWP